MGNAIEIDNNRPTPSTRWLEKADRVLGKVALFSKWTNGVSLGVFFLMVVLTFVDVIMRYFFNRPITGTNEITSMMIVALGALSIAYGQSEKSHVTIDVIINILKPKPRAFLDTIITVLNIGLFSILTWRSAAQFFWFIKMNTINTYSIKLPSSPFAGLLFFGCALLLLILFRDLFRNITQCLKLGFKSYHWIIMSFVLILLVVLFVLWAQPTLWQMDLFTVGMIGLAASVIIMLVGMPVSFSMILVGILFIGHIRGINVALDIAGTELFSTLDNYLWAVVAFFVIMGFWCLYAKFGEELYYAAYKWIGHWRGGLAHATIVACAAFSAVVGDTLSTTVTFGTVALPEMRKYKYDDRLSTGTIAAGSTLGPMIPPSMGFLFYAIITNQSIGKLFIAGVIPGILLTLAFMATIYIQCRAHPLFGPAGEKSSWKNRFVSTKSGGPIVTLFLLVIGGIYIGIFTPTEGGGIGAAGALILGLIMGRFTWRGFYESLLESGKNMAFLLLILVGATIFTRFIAWCNLTGVIQHAILSWSIPPLLVMVIILAIFFALGPITDTLPLVLIGVPIFHPIGVALGYDPVWLAVEIVAMIQLGQITPPVAEVLFVLKSVGKDIPLSTIFKGVWPFVWATIAVIVLMLIFPVLATWLPNLMYPSPK